MNKNSIIVGGCQIPVSQDIRFNLMNLKKAIDWAAAEGVDILCTPECSLTGYLWAPESEKQEAVALTHNALIEIQKYAGFREVDLMLGTGWYSIQGQWANELLYIVNGECVGVYQKSILFPAEEQFYAKGEGQVSVIDYKGFKIAGLICNDFWSNPISFPGESAALLNSLKEQEVDILFLAANTPKIPGTEELTNRWHTTCLEMYSMYCGFHTVVVDGMVQSLPIVTAPSGVVTNDAEWLVKNPDANEFYFKAKLEKPKRIDLSIIEKIN